MHVDYYTNHLSVDMKYNYGRFRLYVASKSLHNEMQIDSDFKAQCDAIQ